MSPSLRGSGLKLLRICLICLQMASPSLRGSGLKSRTTPKSDWFAAVSLFTREWIEIVKGRILFREGTVSLFTREWIEIGLLRCPWSVAGCLPLYEGVDWNLWDKISKNSFCIKSLPLYEGVDWNSLVTGCCRCEGLVSLFTREWIEIITVFIKRLYGAVSLFTREWIEIKMHLRLQSKQLCVSLFTREWIEIRTALQIAINPPSLPLYEGVDWNSHIRWQVQHKQPVSLFTREWIEICSIRFFWRSSLSLPLYEGVDWNLI